MKLWLLPAWMLLVAGQAGAGGVPLEVARLVETGEVRDAIQEVRRRSPSRAEGLVWSSWIWFQARRFQKAEEQVQRAVEAGAPEVETAFLEAQILDVQGKHSEALRLLRSLGSRRETIQGKGLEGELLRSLGRHHEAAEAFVACIDLFNSHADPSPEDRLRAARAGRFNRDPYGALKHLEVLLRRHPWMVRARFEMGELFLDHYQTGDAVQEFRAGLEIRPRSPLLKGALAAALFEDGEREEAITVAKEALETDPLEPRAWQTLAWTALSKSDWKAALHAASKALERNPGDPRFLALQAQVLLSSGDQAGATRIGEGIRKIDPSNTDLDRVMAKMAAKEGRTEAALDLWKGALERDPRCAPCFFERGEHHLLVGRLSAAREDLEKARYLDPFLVKAVNFLKILDRFELFGHFPLGSGLLALSPYGPSATWPYYQEEVDGLLTRLQTDLGHRLRQSLRVEVFGDQRWMNARALGLGIEFGSGFSFGRCLVFHSSPTEAYTMSWRRTMRHELVHSFNADRTDPHPVPPWFTEGLATFLEGGRGETAEGILRGAHFLGELSSLQELLAWKYGGPKLYLHYLQAAVAVEWILSRTDALGFNRFLDHFAQGKKTEEVFPLVLGDSVEALEGAYAAFLEAKVSEIHADLEFRFPPLKLSDRARQGDAAARVKLAMFALRTGDLPRARLLIADQSGAEAEVVRARLLFAAQEAGALKALEDLVSSGGADYGTLGDLGSARFQAGDRQGAQEIFQAAHRLHPGGRQVSLRLARLYQEDGKTDARRGVLADLLREDPDHAWVARELATLARDRGDLDQAVEYLRQAIGTDATRPEFFLELARIHAQAGHLALSRRAYAAFAGLSRLGLEPMRLGLPVPEQLRLTEPQVSGLAPSPPGGPPGTEAWFEPVSVAERTRSASALLELARGESNPDVAAAGVMDAFSRELEEWGREVPRDGLEHLRMGLHGCWGGRAARAAALALGMDGRAEAAGFLMASLDSREEGPFGFGGCSEQVREVLEQLAVTERKNLELWWGELRSKNPKAWLFSSLRDRGYPEAPPEADGEAKLLAIVLEDDSWFRAQAAWRRLSELLGTRVGRRGFLSGVSGDSNFEPVRDQARAAFKRHLAERHLQRNPGSGSP